MCRLSESSVELFKSCYTLYLVTTFLVFLCADNALASNAVHRMQSVMDVLLLLVVSVPLLSGH